MRYAYDKFPRPSGLGHALPWPPPLPLDNVLGSAIAAFKLTKDEAATVADSLQKMANAAEEVRRLSPDGIKGELAAMIRRQQSGDPDISLREIQAQARKLESAHVELEATLEVTGAIVARAESALVPIAERLVDGVCATFESFAAQMELLKAEQQKLFPEGDDEDFDTARLRETRSVLANYRSMIRGGQARHWLGAWGIISKTLPPPRVID